MRRLNFALGLLSLLFFWSSAAAQEHPPARALLEQLTAVPRLAGTPGSAIGAEIVAKHLRDAGFVVEFDCREVLLSLPRYLRVEFFASAEIETAFFQSESRYDPKAEIVGDIPPFNAWSASGSVRGPVVDAGRGLREDFERLRAAGVELSGTIALCAYGGAYRGVKPALASEYGCVGVLLYNRSADSGGERGPVWPEGPWKGVEEAERGSILPIAEGPGDPTTPGWGSPAPGVEPPAGYARRGGAQLAAVLPKLLCMPIGAGAAELLLARLAQGATAGASNAGAGPVEVQLTIEAPAELALITNVIGRLAGSSSEVVIAGNHRDSWVRGAHDAGGGTVSLLRAAAHLGARAQAGWTPERTILLAFWDAEEQGLIGSTEWGEAHAEWLSQQCILYVNADTAVSGTKFGCSGTPGLEAFVLRALATVPDPLAPTESLAAHWKEGASSPTVLGLPGSGSDFTVFLHHLCLPVLDVGFGGAPATGQYHTAFDDLACVERFIDPGFVGHESAGLVLAALLQRAASEGPSLLDAHSAASAMAAHARAAKTWLGEKYAQELGLAFDALAEAAQGKVAPDFYRQFALPQGLPGRAWFKLGLWVPGLEKGYGSESFPLLRLARAESEQALAHAHAALLAEITALTQRLEMRESDPTPGRPADSKRAP